MTGRVAIILQGASVLEWFVEQGYRVVGLGEALLSRCRGVVAVMDHWAWTLWERYAANIPRLWLVAGGQTCPNLYQAEVAIREEYLFERNNWRLVKSKDGNLRRYFWRGRCIAEVTPHPTGWDAWQERVADHGAESDYSECWAENSVAAPNLCDFAHQVYFPESERSRTGSRKATS